MKKKLEDIKIERCDNCNKILSVQKFVDCMGDYKFFRAHVLISDMTFYKQRKGQDVWMGIKRFCTIKCLIKYIKDRISSKRV